MNNELRNDEERKIAALTAAVLADDGGPVSPGESSVAPAGAAQAAASEEPAAPLFSSGEAAEFRVRWDTIQGAFVDEPRSAVLQADSLVLETMKRLAAVFADERAKLEGQWTRDESVSTEDLRLALRRYRSFFGRLLSV